MHFGFEMKKELEPCWSLDSMILLHQLELCIVVDNKTILQKSGETVIPELVKFEIESKFWFFKEM